MPDHLSEASETIKKRVEALNERHPHLDTSVAEEQGLVLIENPWGDESVAFIAFRDKKINDDLFDVLEKVILPEEYSAIYHEDEDLLEVIWTAYKLDKASDEIKGRKFNLKFENKEFECEFKTSSDRLLCLARCAAYLRVSETGFRSLQSFSAYESSEEKSERFGEPISFYIKCMGKKVANWSNVIKHLNFYLKYYDNHSPYIVVHETSENARKDKIRYIEESFPESINSRVLNENLLSFWIASYTHDITTRFLLYYRILEYVSGLYLQSLQRHELLKLLSSPSALAAIDGTLDKLTAIIRQDNMSDMDRYLRMFEELVDKKRMWAEIEANLDTFSVETEFEGGLKLKPLISKDAKFEAFGSKEMQACARSLRSIRHGLSHGGEVQAGRLILPTKENFHLLVPWMHLAMTAAGEVLLYEHLS